MVLTRHVLPGMLARGRGHVVVVSSLAGRGGNAYNVLYATTKAGLVGFARSLRAELSASPVGVSVICPGFIARDGMYARMQEFGVNAPLALRAVEPERVAQAVVAAIVDDHRTCSSPAGRCARCSPSRSWRRDWPSGSSPPREPGTSSQDSPR